MMESMGMADWFEVVMESCCELAKCNAEVYNGEELDPNINFAEMDKLEQLLVEADIPYEKSRVFGGKQLQYPCKGSDRVCSVILHKGSLTPDSIKKVIYNDPATIIFWSDGTKTVVKCMEDEEYDPEKGFMAAVTKKVFGDKYGWVLRHHVKPAMENKDKVDALMDAFAGALHRKRTAKESAACIRDQMMLSGATNWELETFDRFVRKYISDKEEK